MRAGLILLAALALASGPARALELTLPGSARLTGEVLRDPDSYMLPVAPFADGALPVVEVEGRVLQQAWRIEEVGVTTLQMIRPLREQLSAAGYYVILDCGGQECGGFDFRFSTRVMAAPDMFIDLFDFRFLSARLDDPENVLPTRYVSLFVSRAGNTGYVQVIQVTQTGAEDGLRVEAEAVGPAKSTETQDGSASFIEALTEQGHVILTDLDFATGSSDLGAGPHKSLAMLAAYLLADGSRRVALVGHTDLVGSLEDNVALSKRRAISVLDRLGEVYGVPRAQLEAEGVGYLSPIAPNRTAGGRELNRRVEAVLLNHE